MECTCTNIYALSSTHKHRHKGYFQSANLQNIGLPYLGSYVPKTSSKSIKQKILRLLFDKLALLLILASKCRF